MNINILLGLAGTICLIGLFFRLSIWFSQELHPPASPVTIGQRIFDSMQSVLRTIFSSKILLIVKSLFVDLLFQKRIFDKSYLRWIAHSLIFFGFIMLLLMHAMDSIIMDRFFLDYQSTLNPYLFLRNLFGVLVLAGVAVAVFRRVSLRSQRLKTYPSDWAALIFIAVIILSGMMLEGAKISSYTTYQNMVEEYGSFDEQEADALEAFWVQKNGLVSPDFKKPQPEERVAYGMEVNGDSCMECHAANSSAFASFAAKNVAQSISAAVGDSQALTMFWYLHILACLSFLAWLPFSKMFHIIAAPISLIIKGISGDKSGETATLLTNQMIGLSACTHCGSCSIECSSNMFFESFQNDFILPSEKVQFLKEYAAGRVTDKADLKRLQQGLYVCTSCDRCTDICPSGINLKEIFVTARYSLLDRGIPEVSMLSHFSFPLALAQSFAGDHLKALKTVTNLFRKTFKQLSEITLPMTLSKSRNEKNSSFKSCFSCQRCTNICPVVRSFENPVESLGLLPHQIMFSLGLGNTDLAMGSKMIWNCSTCYLCQEHCPNGVELCDIFYSLKNDALNKIEAGVSS